MTKQTVAVTVIGADKPGLINQLSQVVANQNANWLESHMANLAGQFAGIIQIEVDTNKVQLLVDALAALSDVGLKIVVSMNEPITPDLPDGRLMKLELVGQDHPGIISEITGVLSARQVSLEELQTHTQSASMAGGTLFHAQAVLKVPSCVSTDELERSFYALSDSLMVDIEFEEVERHDATEFLAVVRA